MCLWQIQLYEYVFRSDRIVILGVGVHEDESCRRCYVSIVSGTV